ncbi:MAG: helix-turn-helix domain-containing protein [Rickettsiales bacterium]|nr:helix-turn-helix domain-containing protein [Rickettsiales bacterium]
MSQPHPIDVHVGKRLRLRRSILGMSQEALGGAIGITFQQVQKYERGVNRMGASRLYQFAKLLNTNVSYFFDEFQEMAEGNAGLGLAESEAASFEHDKMASRETMEMMRAYYKIPSAAARKRIFELVKTLSED